ncbi:hypothetical protein BDN71DRAFT_1428566 [Pleurotus eryngii]|uniref:Uncharacterized protein n=1 Tax=Pleurotus eryngii TaxID=5323 RepID=A0A9P6A3X2_PLEER|nr:hypothetical protein BDN71DRAFT_1428566 [Pleurotus eryngii]
MGIKATIVQSAPNRPSTLGEGNVDAALLWEWFTKCENYLQHKDVSGLPMTKSVAYGMSGVHAIRWLAAMGPVLDQMEWDDYKAQMCLLFLPADWEHTTRMDILHFQQNSKIFIDYAFKLMGKSNLLTGTDSFMNDDYMRGTIGAGMDAELFRECNCEGTGHIESFKAWLDKMSATIAKLSLKAAPTMRTPFLRHGTPTSTASTKTLAPMPKLTSEEQNLLSTNGGCYKCQKFWAGHIGPCCTAPPIDGSTYKTLTAADVPPHPADFSVCGNLSRTTVTAIVP